MVLKKSKSINKFGITFNEKGEAIVSIREITVLLERVKWGELFCDEPEPSAQSYLLVESNSSGFYVFPKDKLEAWEDDGSFEKGDSLYKIELIKRY